MTIPDTIEREIHIESEPAAVWRVLTSAEHLGQWFGDAGAEIELRPGGALRLSWREFGTVHGRVEAVEEPSRFAFRWAIGGGEAITPDRSTLVEFTLAADTGGTRLRVVESGFGALDVSEEDRTARFDGNTRGWEKELGHLVEHLARVAA